MAQVYFISGIDTDCGKTLVTGLLARQFAQQGISTITQKLVQTGCTGISEDILEHRKIMGIDLQDVDKEKITCPYVFKFPASPHLASSLEKQVIDCDRITACTRELAKLYDIILLEGAGGLYVPIREDLLIIDYLQEMNYPLILVSSSKLGSINHTLMSLELCRSRNIQVKALVYDHFPNENNTLTEESRNVFKKYLHENSPKTVIIDCPEVNDIATQKLAIDDVFIGS